MTALKVPEVVSHYEGPVLGASRKNNGTRRKRAISAVAAGTRAADTLLFVDDGMVAFGVE